MTEPIAELLTEREERIKKRYDDFVVWLDSYKSYLVRFLKLQEAEITFKGGLSIEEIALRLNTSYWLRLQKLAKGYVSDGNGNNTNIRHPKIISGIELTIIEQQPFDAGKSEASAIMNAKFAMFVAIAIMCQWNGFELSSYIKVTKDEAIARFLKDHETWLMNLEPEFEYPIFLNAQVWDLFLSYINLKIQAI